MTAEERNELRIFANKNYKQAFMPTILILLDELDRLEAEVRQANDDSARSMMVANQACVIATETKGMLDQVLQSLPKSELEKVRRKTTTVVACTACGQSFCPRRKGHVFCSHRCGNRAAVRQFRARNREKDE